MSSAQASLAKATGHACGDSLSFVSESRDSIGALTRNNPAIQILSNGGRPTHIPRRWGTILQDSEVLVCIPDMHMYLYNSPLDQFRPGARALLDLLKYLEQLQANLDAEGKRLRVMQLGDMFELCFPRAAGGKVTVNDIRRSHPLYQEILDVFRRLDTTFVKGNHDFWYHQMMQSPEVVSDGRVRIAHGYAADNWYYFSNPYLFGWRPAVATLRWARTMEAQMHRLQPRSYRLKRLRNLREAESMRQLRAQQLPESRLYPRRQLRYFHNLLQSLEPAQRPRICLVAHTHHPVVDVNWSDGECLLVDAGAWTSGRTDFAIITNSEVAVCRYDLSRVARLPARMRLAV